ncbi:ATP-binding protein [uncultured Treponema sp.]|uniref:ATP-binding protein n=1 Tax=uncultured Treponema sp. TaxID=162155 RepID=UPI0025D5AC56|nr:ATP-binding protein [uncultured Treponema sp.]
MEELPDIQRESFLDRLRTFKDKQLIKVVTGIRRCGKSTLLAQWQRILLKEGAEENQIVSINFEDYEFKNLCNNDSFYTYVKKRLIPGRRMYLFFDEIQRVPQFEEVVDSFFINPLLDIYITGSNSGILSSELATYLSGRYVEIKMQPLSFKEFVHAKKLEQNLPNAYRQYLENSSFPYSLCIERTGINDYLESLYNTILVKDIISRKKITDVFQLQSVAEFVFDNIGLEVSSKKIADTMTSSGRKTDSRMVENYLSSLVETYIVYKVKRYNIKGKEYLKSLEKYYVADIALRSALIGKKSMDAGHILENIVYLELVRRRYNVYVGKIDEAEVDFVAQSQDGNTYIQVAATVRDEQTLERELRPLKAIKDNYPKMILTLDDDPQGDYDGIIRKNALEWLMEDL